MRIIFLAAFMLLAAAQTAQAQAQVPLTSIIDNDLYIVRRATMPSGTISVPYDYAPSISYDDSRGTYSMYWCAGTGGVGDYVLHATAPAPEGPWSEPRIVLMGLKAYPAAHAPSFDENHTCDPSVIKQGGKYYLYYGGASNAVGTETAIGVAVSDDGDNFTRLNNGQPIVSPAHSQPNTEGTYGAGQPSVIYMAPYFYMSFTDSTGTGGVANSGFGLYVIRATDPTFRENRQEFVGTGWESRAPGVHTAQYAYLQGVNIDWMYDAPTDKIIMAWHHSSYQQTDLLFLDPQNFGVVATTSLPGRWRDGPGILSGIDRNAIERDSCADLILGAATGNGPNALEAVADQNPLLDLSNWDLSFSMGHYDASALCAGRPDAPISSYALFRFYNAQTGDHTLAQSASAAIPGFALEGPAFAAFTNGPGMVKLYECVEGDDHFSATHANCDRTQQVGALGYLFAQPADGLTPVYRLLKNDGSGNVRHLTTAVPTEGQASGFVVEGILGYTQQ